ncbi:macrolide transporter subunit MacA [Gallaecimonas mangrovi]|uniref:macrolide transporter subunit MacA n=1 Tax=Gallaecimonas mangrovi TaxID=2291597 RepID=UPI000E203BD0|nr:macrolide transporter subunit MacA [Gallaecimonas mangrovi]
MKKQALRKWLWGGLGVVVLAGVGYLVVPKPPKHNFLTVAVKRGNIESAVLASGVLEPSREVDVGAQVSGQLESLKVHLGETVKKGQLLAVIDPSVKENDLKSAQASLDNIRAQKREKVAVLKQYKAQYEREQAMSSQDAAAIEDLQSAEANYQSTKAEIDALDAQIVSAEVDVSTAKTNLGYTQITAPIDGVVTSIVTKEGQTVNSNQSAPTILVLSDLDTMTIKAEISEADVTKVQSGQSVYFTTLGEPSKKYDAKLASIDPYPTIISGDSSTATTASEISDAIYYYGLFNVKNPGHRLRKFMTAEVHIVLSDAKNVLTIPISQLGKSMGGNKYMVSVMGPGHPERREITTGIRDNINVQVLSGLNDGDKVIVGDNSMQFSADDDHHPHGPFGF